MQITLSNITRSYKDAQKKLAVIDSMTFAFPAQGSLAIVGRSGVGKSTLLNLLGGLDRPNTGKVLYDNRAINHMGDEELSLFRGAHIGFIFQFHHLLPEFSALENVVMPLLIQGTSEAEAAERATEVLERVGLSSRLDHRPSQLSGGEQQRVAIARALVTKPAVVLADEPTGNLDFETAAEVKTLLVECQKELKNVLIVVTHSKELASSMDTTLEMRPGGQLEKVSR
jgi:lipoprotein-releasing system ATP-binding protein